MAGKLAWSGLIAAVAVTSTAAGAIVGNAVGDATEPEHAYVHDDPGGEPPRPAEKAPPDRGD